MGGTVTSACPPTKGPAYRWPHPSSSPAQLPLKVEIANVRNDKLECAKEESNKSNMVMATLRRITKNISEFLKAE